jgi:hypothetical protein
MSDLKSAYQAAMIKAEQVHGALTEREQHIAETAARKAYEMAHREIAALPTQYADHAMPDHDRTPPKRRVDPGRYPPTVSRVMANFSRELAAQPDVSEQDKQAYLNAAELWDAFALGGPRDQ